MLILHRDIRSFVGRTVNHMVHRPALCKQRPQIKCSANRRWGHFTSAEFRGNTWGTRTQRGVDSACQDNLTNANRREREVRGRESWEGERGGRESERGRREREVGGRTRGGRERGRRER